MWEGERWTWPVRTQFGQGQVPEAGDVIVFFYAPSGGTDGGFMAGRLSSNGFKTRRVNTVFVRWRPVII
jgi:hypothetical protein